MAGLSSARARTRSRSRLRPAPPRPRRCATWAPVVAAVPGATTVRSGNSRKYQTYGHCTSRSSAMLRLWLPVGSRAEPSLTPTSRARRSKRSMLGRVPSVAVRCARSSVPRSARLKASRFAERSPNAPSSRAATRRAIKTGCLSCLFVPARRRLCARPDRPAARPPGRARRPGAARPRAHLPGRRPG